MKADLFDYNLPEKLIAQYPADKRDESNLMVLNRTTQEICHKKFYDIIDLLNENDVLVFNNSKVFPARIIGKIYNSDTEVEIFLLRKIEHYKYEALVKPGKKLKPGKTVEINKNGYNIKLKILEISTLGRIIEFEHIDGLEEMLDKIGQVPLPPYIKRSPTEKDIQRYQTVYAKEKGSVAAPTAGLHFTEKILNKLKNKGIEQIPVTLHVGPGTFKPVKSENIEDHKMDYEYFTINKQSINILKNAIKNQKNIVAVGTTSVRVLESLPYPVDKIPDEGIAGFTDIFIYPPYKFKYVNKLITNFHLPKSTLIMLVSAFAGRDFTLKAYSIAVEKKYRFYSYGDAMLII